LTCLLPVPHIEEGENVYMPLGDNLEIFQRELPAISVDKLITLCRS